MNFDHLSDLIRSNTAASYFVGKYYFTVNTNRFRKEIKSKSDEYWSPEEQTTLRNSNYISLFHEYIHYIHEISTVVGNTGLGLDILSKSIFSNYFNQDLTSSFHNGIDRTDEQKFPLFCNIHVSKQLLDGNAIQNERLLQVISVTSSPQIFHLVDGTEQVEHEIEIPLITIQSYEHGNFVSKDILFGKFFIYEGIAYELDRIIHKQVNGLSVIQDEHKSTEYTVLRNLAKYIIPDIDTYSFLVLASLSLSYLDCGNMFIHMLKKLKTETEAGVLKAVVIKKLKEKVAKILLEKQEDFNVAQDEIADVFLKRNQLNTAFQVIGRQSKRAYFAKCHNPSFEVDLIFAGEYENLFTLVPPCDYMYVFKDNDEYMRDIMGTASFDEDSSHALKILIAYDHYQKKHELLSTLEVEAKKTIKCPFYTCCNLQIRSEHASICASKPWRSFEISSATDKHYCWYGQAVLEFKGHNEQ